MLISEDVDKYSSPHWRLHHPWPVSHQSCWSVHIIIKYQSFTYFCNVNNHLIFQGICLQLLFSEHQTWTWSAPSDTSSSCWRSTTPPSHCSPPSPSPSPCSGLTGSSGYIPIFYHISYQVRIETIVDTQHIQKYHKCQPLATPPPTVFNEVKNSSTSFLTHSDLKCKELNIKT